MARKQALDRTDDGAFPNLVSLTPSARAAIFSCFLLFHSFSPFSSFQDFLPKPSTCLYNLRPTAEGEIVIERASLGSGGVLRVVAVDSEDVAFRQVGLDAP